ncbi:MAG TPA: hypothetical protein VGM15_03110 [Burkholderiaceae bacterium]|jgi:hypothetical protein
MPKFRKKPIVIEAMQFTGQTASACAIVHWALSEPVNRIKIMHDGTSWIEIQTPEGTMRADAGDWIIRGVKGEYYPCKPDIFAATYEPVEG